MMQMSGFLKCTATEDDGVQEHPKAIGFIGECKPIESMSIVEMTIERSSFTSTTTLDLKFIAVESRSVKHSVCVTASYVHWGSMQARVV